MFCVSFLKRGLANFPQTLFKTKLSNTSKSGSLNGQYRALNEAEINTSLKGVGTKKAIKTVLELIRSHVD